MKKFKYIILGAGPSGLSLAHSLLRKGESSLLILEKEDVAGGLCRSEEVDGSPLDIGGGHFLDVKRPEVLEFLFSFLPETEWTRYQRISKIKFNQNLIDYPFESHIWQMPIDDQIKFLESIAQAGSNLGISMPSDFESWISWKLGTKIAEEYMLPYNRKIWSIDLNLLGTYWLYKLPNVSFQDTLRSCLQRKSEGALPAHGSFYYPTKKGYGEVWRIMGEELDEKLILNYKLKALNFDDLTINGEFQAERIISTVPWQAIDAITRLPPEVSDLIGMLEYSSVRVEYRRKFEYANAHWIYEPDENISYHRILCRSNFVEKSKGSWTECNIKRAKATDNWYHDNEFAYPLNLRDKPETISSILSWFDKKGIVGLGRWGRWEHMNSDVAVQEAMALAENI